jgi:hypothetical protein
MNVRVLADVQKQIEFLGKERIVVLEFEPEEGKASMNEPRPATISALPFESRSSVANSWNTRTGSARSGRDSAR